MKAGSDAAFVVDASMAIAWALPAQATEESSAALNAFLSGGSALAPGIWPLEVANGLLVLERRRKMTKDERHIALSRLSKLRIVIDHTGAAAAFAQISELATDFNLSVYDASYLELAARTGLPLACKDGALRAAARKAGVTVWQGAVSE